VKSQGPTRVRDPHAFKLHAGTNAGIALGITTPIAGERELSAPACGLIGDAGEIMLVDKLFHDSVTS